MDRRKSSNERILDFLKLLKKSLYILSEWKTCLNEFFGKWSNRDECFIRVLENLYR